MGLECCHDPSTARRKRRDAPVGMTILKTGASRPTLGPFEAQGKRDDSLDAGIGYARWIRNSEELVMASFLMGWMGDVLLVLPEVDDESGDGGEEQSNCY